LRGNAPGYVTPASPKGEPLMPKKKLTDLFVERVRGAGQRGASNISTRRFRGWRYASSEQRRKSLVAVLPAQRPAIPVHYRDVSANQTCADARREAQAALDQVRRRHRSRCRKAQTPIPCGRPEG